MKAKKKEVKIPKVGDTIYVDSSMSISHGSDDFVGGKATVSHVETKYGNVWVSIKERPGHSYTWGFLSEKQDFLKKEFGNKKSYADPDIDTPWIEEGDWVDGQRYHGPPIW